MDLPWICHVGIILLLAKYSSACPQIVASLCRCEDLHNGVVLNCSDTDGAKVLEILKASQAQLGLIQNLVMHHANIRAIPASFFAGLYIKRLDLSYNKMVLLDPAAFAGMGPFLQELILTHNNLTEIPSDALTELKTLLKLDLSNNTIGDLSAEKAIPALPKLFDINLAHNKICGIHKNALVGVRDTVQTINFGHNCLSAVPAPAIRGFKQLMALHMLHNEITTLDSLSFMNLPVMNLLNLASNKISEIKPQAFLNVPKLSYLYLTNNHIATIASHQFSGFEQLEMLDLTNNYIESLPKNAFSGLSKLSQLYLGNNRLSKIEKDAFANSSVAILMLASNNLTSLEEGVLNGLNSLQQLSLKDNHIASVNQNAFYNTPSVALVDMSGNDITELPPATFLSQLNLLVVDLSRNKITRTPYSSFNRRVGTVLLQENPLVCTEKVHMLQDGVGVFLPNSADIICGGHPTTTTTTEEAPALLFDNEQTENDGEDTQAVPSTPEVVEPKPLDPLQSRLAIQDIPPTRIKLDQAEGPTILGIDGPLQPVHAEHNRPNMLNIRPSNIVSRPRNHFGSELSMPANGRLPSRENPFSRTAVHVPAHALPATTVNPDEEGGEEEAAAAQPAPTASDDLPPHVDLPDVADAALVKMLSAISLPPTTTEEPLERPVTDIADNPNIIHPFPVPFLKRGPGLSSSQRIRSTSTTTLGPENGEADENNSIPVNEIAPVEMHTLPPSIVIAPRRPSPPVATEVDANRIQTAGEGKKFTEFALRTQPPNEIATGVTGEESKADARMATPSLIIGVCLSTVALAMVVVFVGLCVAKHRQMRRLGSSSSDSTTARTTAYVAAQAAQMNMMYGTMNRSRSMSISRPEETSQPWIYAPSNYCSYYK